MNQDLHDFITQTAGELRATTFLEAAKFILEHRCRRIVEAGCYRGNPTEGNSTAIFATLAEETGGTLNSFDVSEVSCNAAEDMLRSMPQPLPVTIQRRDSIEGIADFPFRIHFAYLDSLDCDSNGAAQRHQLAEVGAVIAKMQPPCAIMLDDHDPNGGGKTLLSARWLKERGWTVVVEGYQILFSKLP